MFRRDGSVLIWIKASVPRQVCAGGGEVVKKPPEGRLLIFDPIRSALSAVIDAGRAPAGGAPGHPGDADGGQWPSDNSVRRRNQPVGAGNWQRSSDFKRAQSKECSSDGQS
jgi:hypothetical protein